MNKLLRREHSITKFIKQKLKLLWLILVFKYTSIVNPFKILQIFRFKIIKI
jgi:hypothetical protein